MARPIDKVIMRIKGIRKNRHGTWAKSCRHIVRIHLVLLTITLIHHHLLTRLF